VCVCAYSSRLKEGLYQMLLLVWETVHPGWVQSCKGKGKGKGREVKGGLDDKSSKEGWRQIEIVRHRLHSVVAIFSMIRNERNEATESN
jgi:hypothetical protein